MARAAEDDGVNLDPSAISLGLMLRNAIAGVACVHLATVRVSKNTSRVYPTCALEVIDLG